MSDKNIEDIDTANYHLITVNGPRILMMKPPNGPLTVTQAYAMAAWLVVMADCANGGAERPFTDYLFAVRNT